CGHFGLGGSPATALSARGGTTRDIVARRVRRGWLLRRLRVVEVRQEGEVLGEVLLDRRHAARNPLLDPRRGEVVLDPVKIALVHATIIDACDAAHMSRSAHLSSPDRPIGSRSSGWVPDRERALRRGLRNPGPGGGSGAARRGGARPAPGRGPGGGRRG